MNKESKAAMLQLLKDPAGCSVTIMGDLSAYRTAEGKYAVELCDPDDNPVYNSKLLPPRKPLYQERLFDTAEEAVEFLCQVREEVKCGADYGPRKKEKKKWQRLLEEEQFISRR